MWSLKFLSGPKAGKEIFLQPGLTVLGRGDSCQISISAEGISKKHAQILINDSGVFVEDMDSRNGTFFKGKQIKKQKLEEGSRVALSDVIFELRRKDPMQVFSSYGLVYGQGAPQTDLSTPDGGLQKNTAGVKNSFFAGIKKLIRSYLDNVVLPGVYKLAEWIEFKALVGFFIIGFVVVITVLSSFPLISILKSSVEQESRNNAENIAITLATGNRKHLKKGLQNAVSVDYALRRPGVKNAYIISAVDGRILAPAELAHTYPKSPVIHKARKQNQKTVAKMDSSSLAAIVPISFYNPETGENMPRAYSVVIYDMSTLSVGTKKVASLLVQTFLITCVIGFILFFFLINLIEFPVRSINRQLGRSLKDEKAPSVSIDYQSKVLTELCSHINSALNQISLNRMLSAKEEDHESGEVNRQNEMSNLVEIIGFPALSINIEEETVASLNSNFSDQIGFSEILHQPVSEISDSRLKDHLLELIEQGKSNPQEIAFGEVHLNQMSLQSTCQFIMGKKSPAYAIVTFMSPEAEEGAA